MESLRSPRSLALDDCNMNIHTTLSIIIYLLFVALAIPIIMKGEDLFEHIFLPFIPLIPMAMIWFPDAINDFFNANTFTRGGPINKSTPIGCVVFFGWIYLLSIFSLVLYAYIK